MLESSKTDATIAQMVANSLDRMPNFSEDLQNNNVLTRRILELKVKKGFAINAEEAEKNMKTNMRQYATNVSSALTANQVGDNQLTGLDLDGSKRNQFKTGQAQPARAPEPQPVVQAQESNLLDLLDEPQQQIQEKPLDTMAELSEALGYTQEQQDTAYNNNQNQLTSNDLFQSMDNMGMSATASTEASHPFKDAYPDTFSPSQTVQVQANDCLSRDCANFDDWKKM